MSYPGGKAGPGVYQRLINEIPPHDFYVAGFAGHDAISRFKKPARQNILFDLDPEPLDWWAEYLSASDRNRSQWYLHNIDCMQWLETVFLAGPVDVFGDALSRRWFVYLDPPYLMETRTSGPIYRHELSPDGHRRMLRIAKQLPCNVMISGYWSRLYAEELADWRYFTYEATCRSGEKRTEYAWCNYPVPARLHDSRYVGNDKRQRENIRRRTKRLIANLMALDPHARQAVLDGVAAAEAVKSRDFGSEQSDRCEVTPTSAVTQRPGTVTVSSSPADISAGTSRKQFTPAESRSLDCWNCGSSRMQHTLLESFCPDCNFVSDMAARLTQTIFLGASFTHLYITINTTAFENNSTPKPRNNPSASCDLDDSGAFDSGAKY